MRRRLVLGLALTVILAGVGCGTATPSDPVAAPDRPQLAATPTPVKALLELRAVGERVLLAAPAVTRVAAGLSYTWRQVSGPAAVLSDRQAQYPSIVPSAPGVYVFELTVMEDAVVTALILVEVPVAPAVTSAPGVTIVMPAPGLFGGTLAIEYRLPDTTADPGLVDLSFSTDGGASYARATRATTASGPAARSFDGMTYRVVWHAAADLGNEAVVDVLVRVSHDGASGDLPMTYSPLFDGVSSACGLSAPAWPFDPAVRSEIDGALDGCQTALVAELVELLEGEVAPRVPDFEGTLLLNLPLFIEAHASAAGEGGVNLADLAFLLDRALEAVAQLESLTLSVARVTSDPVAAQAIQAETRKFQTLSNTLRVRHEMAMAAIRNPR